MLDEIDTSAVEDNTLPATTTSPNIVIRSRFPETWIWNFTKTGYLIFENFLTCMPTAIMIVNLYSRHSLRTNKWDWRCHQFLNVARICDR